jgi:predicted  nucleic acid-binding Zn-ribbon protein
MANARHPELDSAAEQIATIKREMARSVGTDFLTRLNTYVREAAADLVVLSAVLADLQTRRGTTERDALQAHGRIAAQRRDIDALRTRLAQLSPVMIEERRLVSADLTAHLEVLDRLRQTEGLLLIELATLEEEIGEKRTQIDRLARSIPPLRTLADSLAAARATVTAAEDQLLRCIALRRQQLPPMVLIPPHHWPPPPRPAIK